MNEIKRTKILKRVKIYGSLDNKRIVELKKKRKKSSAKSKN